MNKSFIVNHNKATADGYQYYWFVARLWWVALKGGGSDA